jgi:arginyl-tRNA--protein-N-Asp/Glu arginylyltransferase
MEREINFEYDVKCRKCNKITRMHFGTNKFTTKENFKIWASEHSTFPIHKQCTCDNGMMLLHDLIGYGNVLDIL